MMVGAVDPRIPRNHAMPSTTALSPAIETLPSNGAVELAFLIFHGVGAHAADMHSLVERLAAEYPQAAVLAFDSPDPFDAVPGGSSGFQWFSIRGISEGNRPARVREAMPAFLATVRAQQQRFGLPWERIALAGFSQGAIMALEAVQCEAHLAGRVLAFCGRHASAPVHAPADTTVHLLHGLDDRVVPCGPAVDAAERLLALGGDVTAHVLPGIAHELHPALLDKAIEQLRGFLPKKVWRQAMSEAPVMPRVASSDELGGGPTPRP
jgi:phospholipase/carboxylesterase